MNLAIDVHYHNEVATVAGLTFADWQACKPNQTIVTQVTTFGDYEPGQFYKRELPCMLALLAKVDPLPNCIVIDGYVFLGKEQKPGLGKYLHEVLEGKAIVIGVAKNRFKGTPVEAELLRGESKRPLYITAIGIDQTQAKQHIREMCGTYRLPKLLKAVDQLCRTM